MLEGKIQEVRVVIKRLLGLAPLPTQSVIIFKLAGKRCRGNGGVSKRYRLEVAVISQHVLAAGVVFTTASDLHDARFLCILAVLATVLTVFFTRTIARGVRALVFILVLSH
jgi:hypothetical protein